MLKVDSWLRLLAWLIVLNRFTLGFVLNSFSNSRLSSSPVFQNFQGLCMIQSSILKVHLSLLSALISQEQLVYVITFFRVCQQLFSFIFLTHCFRSQQRVISYHVAFNLSSSFLFIFSLGKEEQKNNHLEKETEKEGFEPSRRLPDLHP